MQAELLQLAGVGVGFLIVLFLWLNIIYLPARTMERWEGNRPGRPGKTGDREDREETREDRAGVN